MDVAAKNLDSNDRFNDDDDKDNYDNDDHVDGDGSQKPRQQSQVQMLNTAILFILSHFHLKGTPLIVYDDNILCLIIYPCADCI